MDPPLLCGAARFLRGTDSLVLQRPQAAIGIKNEVFVDGLVPLGLWLPYFVVFKVAYDLPWTVHMWTGTVFLASVGGVLLSLLAYPPETRETD